MKKVVLLLVVSVLMLGIGASANAETFKGFLANAGFGKTGIDLAGRDLTLWPDTLPVVSMQLAEAALKTGYGVYILASRASETFVSFKFHKFDAKGDELAKAIVEKTQELHGVYVVIEGSMDTNGMLMVTSMEEKDHPVVVRPSSESSGSGSEGSSRR